VDGLLHLPDLSPVADVVHEHLKHDRPCSLIFSLLARDYTAMQSSMLGLNSLFQSSLALSPPFVDGVPRTSLYARGPFRGSLPLPMPHCHLPFKCGMRLSFFFFLTFPFNDDADGRPLFLATHILGNVVLPLQSLCFSPRQGV